MTNSENFKKPYFTGMHNLEFDIDEIDGPLYMFDHAFSGSVALQFSEKIGTEGVIKLNDTVIHSWKIISVIFSENPVICVKVRGLLNEYDTTAKLEISGFGDTNGLIMEKQEFTIKVLPRRNSYPNEYAENDLVAKEVAREGIVLLKNEGMLPLKKNEVLNIFGAGFSEYRSCPVGAGRINPRGYRSIENAILETSNFTLNNDLKEFYLVPNNKTPNSHLLQKASSLSENAVVIITRGTGENIDNRPIKGEYYLTDEEDLLIKNVTSCFKNVCVVLNVGYTIDVSFLKKYNVNACIYSGYSGMFSTESLLEILDGRVNPSGKLADSWANDYFDIPASVNFLNFDENHEVYQTDYLAWSQICYEEGRYIGYRYFETFKKDYAFPFGFGLSYTQFEKRVVGFERKSDSVKIDVSVKNIGEVSGKETVQIYVSKSNSRIDQCSNELVGFEKTKLLSPEEETVLSIEIPFKHLTSYYDKTASWMLFKGNYIFYIGDNAHSLTKVGKITLEEDVCVNKVENRVVTFESIEEIEPSGKQFPNGNLTFVGEDKQFVKAKRLTFDPARIKINSENLKFSDVLKSENNLFSYVDSLSDYELCRLSVCCNKTWNMEEKEVAGRVYNFENGDIPSFVLADGNNGINIKKPNIGMPASSMLASTFNKGLAYSVGEIIAKEAKENGVNLILGPAMNIHRNPLNGRGAEYFSEDPYLAGVIAGYQNKGLQQNGVSGCIKHVAANNCEAVRKRSNSIMTERTLREIYLKCFELAQEIEPADSIMTGYNALNNCFCDEDSELILGIFCEEFGFDGFAMSDWNSYDTSYIPDMINAGISLITPGSDDDTKVDPILNALKSGKIKRERLVENVAKMLRVIAKRKCL